MRSGGALLVRVLGLELPMKGTSLSPESIRRVVVGDLSHNKFFKPELVLLNSSRQRSLPEHLQPPRRGPGSFHIDEHVSVVSNSDLLVHGGSAAVPSRSASAGTSLDHVSFSPAAVVTAEAGGILAVGGSAPIEQEWSKVRGVGFHCISKSLPSDWRVHEVDPKGSRVDGSYGAGGADSTLPHAVRRIMSTVDVACSFFERRISHGDLSNTARTDFEMSKAHVPPASVWPSFSTALTLRLYSRSETLRGLDISAGIMGASDCTFVRMDSRPSPLLCGIRQRTNDATVARVCAFLAHVCELDLVGAAADDHAVLLAWPRDMAETTHAVVARDIEAWSNTILSRAASGRVLTCTCHAGALLLTLAARPRASGTGVVVSQRGPTMETSVVEFVLEKKGLHHSHVMDSLLEDLSALREEWYAAHLPHHSQSQVEEFLRCLPQIALSTTGVQERDAQTFQRLRVRGCPEAVVRELALHVMVRSRQPVPLMLVRAPSGSLPPPQVLFQQIGAPAESELGDDHVGFDLHSPRTLLREEVCLHHVKLSQRDAAIQALNSKAAALDLKIGQCASFEYAITLRHIPPSQRPVLSSCVGRVCGPTSRDDDGLYSVRPDACSSAGGFLNYFGQQRFQWFSARNMHVGLHLLKGQFRAAADILIGGDVRERSARSREAEEGGNRLVSALRQVLTNNEATSEGDFQRAFLLAMGTDGCRLFVTEFLSFVWNDILSQRIRIFGGRTILAGDIVRPHEPDGTPARVGRPVFATDEDIRNGRFTYRDVVLPIPGYRVQLPDNPTQDIYVRALADYGITVDPVTERWELFSGANRVDAPIRSASAPQHGNALGVEIRGGYRYAYEVPRRFTYTIGRDTMDGRDGGVIHSYDDRTNLKHPVRAERSAPLCLKMTFLLPPTAYPAMLIREITRLRVHDARSVHAVTQYFSTHDAVASREFMPTYRDMSDEDKVLYRKYISRRGRRERTFGRALLIANMRRQIFKARGARSSLMPTMLSPKSVGVAVD